jgi:DNA-binding protein H-NS
MTHPGGASGMQSMISTIVQLRQLQLAEAAQKLQEQQIGIQRMNEQSGATRDIASMLPGMTNPQALIPFADQFTGRTGLDVDALKAIISGTPASSSTTKSAAVQSGATQLAGSLDVPAATIELTGQTPGAQAYDALRNELFHGATDYYNQLPDQGKTGFHQGVLQQVATGQDVGSAASSQAFADFMQRAPQNVKDQMVAVGKGLAPSADQVAQMQLGWAHERLQQRQTDMSLALEDLRVHAGIAEARQRLDKEAFQMTNQLVEKRSELLNNMSKMSSTMTGEGVRSYATQLNAFNEQIRQAAPMIYGPKGTHPLYDIPTDATIGASGFGPFLSQYLQGLPQPSKP